LNNLSKRDEIQNLAAEIAEQMRPMVPEHRLNESNIHLTMHCICPSSLFYEYEPDMRK
jgi:hypothetical protein